MAAEATGVDRENRGSDDAAANGRKDQREETTRSVICWWEKHKGKVKQ